MIEVDPEAQVELLDARDFYEGVRPGLGILFELAAQRTIDAIEASPLAFAVHPFATVPNVRRALLAPPPRFPFALAYLIHPPGHPYVLAAEHLRREPMFWRMRLAAFKP
jgi:hypothetical protein